MERHDEKARGSDGRDSMVPAASAKACGTGVLGIGAGGVKLPAGPQHLIPGLSVAAMSAVLQARLAFFERRDASEEDRHRAEILRTLLTTAIGAPMLRPPLLREVVQYERIAGGVAVLIPLAVSTGAIIHMANAEAVSHQRSPLVEPRSIPLWQELAGEQGIGAERGRRYEMNLSPQVEGVQVNAPLEAVLVAVMCDELARSSAGERIAPLGAVYRGADSQRAIRKGPYGYAIDAYNASGQ